MYASLRGNKKNKSCKPQMHLKDSWTVYSPGRIWMWHLYRSCKRIVYIVTSWYLLHLVNTNTMSSVIVLRQTWSQQQVNIGSTLCTQKCKTFKIHINVSECNEDCIISHKNDNASNKRTLKSSDNDLLMWYM